MDLLTVREAAAILRVSQVTLRRYVASGKLPAVRIGRNVRIERSAAAAYAVPVTAGYQAATEPGSELPDDPKVFTLDSPLWDLMGFIKDDGPTDMAENHDMYLAEAYADLHEEAYDRPDTHRRTRMTAREALRSKIETLNDEEATQVLGYVDGITRARDDVNRAAVDYVDSRDDDGEYADELTNAVPKLAFAPGSPAWDMVGFIKTEGPTDMGSDKYKYFAQVYGDYHEE